MIFHADSESDLKTTPNQVKNPIKKRFHFYGTSTLNSPYGKIFENNGASWGPIGAVAFSGCVLVDAF